VFALLCMLFMDPASLCTTLNITFCIFGACWCSVLVGVVLLPSSGWKNESVGFHADDGKVFTGSGSGSQELSPPLKVGDVMGCGVVFSDSGTPSQVFFAVNGNVVGRIEAPTVPAGKSLHPHIGFHSTGEKVTFNLKARSPLLATGAAAGFVARRTVPPPRGTRELQELGLRVFSSFVKSFVPAADNGDGDGDGDASAPFHPVVPVTALSGPLQAVASMLDSFDARSLFSEWSPPRDPVQERLDLKGTCPSHFAVCSFAAGVCCLMLRVLLLFCFVLCCFVPFLMSCLPVAWGVQH